MAPSSTASEVFTNSTSKLDPTHNDGANDDATKAVAKSRIDNIVLLLSRMQKDSAFVDECCTLMGCPDKNALMAISLDRLRLELVNYS